MRKRVIAIVLSAIMLASGMLTGCQEKTAEEIINAAMSEEGTQAGTAAGETQEASGSVDEQELNIYNAYIDANNFLVGRFTDVINSYFKYVPYQEEFAPEDPEYWCLNFSEYDFEELKTANDLANAKAEKDSLDEAYIALYPVTEELMKTINEVDSYTDLKSYVDDDYAKGKELHAKIWAACNQYDALSTTFMNEVEAVSSEKESEDLAAMKEEGYEVTYLMNVVMNSAQEIQSAIYSQEIYDENVIELDTETFKPIYDRFTEEVSQCIDLLGDEEKLSAEGFTTMQVDFFKRALQETKVALTELLERVEKQEPLESYELGSSFPAKGSIANFDDKLSSLIDSYNEL